MFITFISISAQGNFRTIDRVSGDFYVQIAEYHAPHVFQKSGKKPKYDAITRFDFDGDFIANNNWDNAKKYPTPAWVYYDVIETVGYYFLHYGFFHPRDYTSIFFCVSVVCHENDYESVTLIIEKDGTKFGKVKWVESLAHNKIMTYKPNFVRLKNQDKNVRSRVGIWIEPSGHGVHQLGKEDFEIEQKCRIQSFHHDFSEQEDKDGGRYADYKDHLVYYKGVTADDPNGKSQGMYSYKLLPVWEHFWQNREFSGWGNLFVKDFQYGGTNFYIGDIPKAFAGEKKSKAQAKPPWGQYDGSCPKVMRGDWFIDPMHALEMHLGTDFGKKSEYTFNPYVGLE